METKHKNEEWRDINGYEGIYKVSSNGRVLYYRKTRSAGVTTKIPSIRKLKKNKTGYIEVALFKNGKYKHLLVHRLVAEAFIPNPYNLPCINHKNEIKSDNNVENLEWCTYTYNNQYSNIPLLTSKRSSVPVLQLTMDGKEINRFDSIREAGLSTGCSANNISNVCRGVMSFTHGYKWEYIDEAKKKKSEETRKRLLEKSRKRKEELILQCRRPVVQYNKDGLLLAEYGSITEAADAVGGYTSYISEFCSGKAKTRTCYGYIFKYKEK